MTKEEPTQPAAVSDSLDRHSPVSLDFHARARARSAVDGWFKARSHAIWDILLRVQQERGIGGHLFEIGVWHGKSAAVLACFRADGEVLALIDPDMPDDAIGRSFAAVGVELDRAHHLLVAKRSSEISILKDFCDLERSVRFMHIDGAHTAADVYRDLKLADDLVSEDGICSVDDFLSAWYPQVTQAVYEYLFCNPHSFRLFLCDEMKCYLCRPGRFFEYYTFCIERLPEELSSRDAGGVVKKTSPLADAHTVSVVENAEWKHARRGPDWDQYSVETLAKRTTSRD